MIHFPSFSTINIEQFPHQLSALLKNNLEKINILLNKPQPWTWDNLIDPLEAMDAELESLWAPLSHLHAVVNSPALRDCYQSCLPELTAYETTMGHNQALFDAINSISRESLNNIQQKIIEDMIRDFKLAGIALSATEKQRFHEINTRLSELSNQFENNILDAENHYQRHITDEQELVGLPEHVLNTALTHAKEKNLNGWCLALNYPCYHAILTYAENRTLREEFYYAYMTRASDIGPTAHQFDNTEIMNEILLLRHEEAQMLGFSNYGEYSLETKMVKHPEQALEFLYDINQRARQQAQDEYAELQAYAKEHLQIKQIEPWDISYIAQKKKQQLYALTDETLRPYFPLTHVIQGLLHIIQTLYGVTFEEVTAQAIDTWHPDVQCFQLLDEQQKPRGYLYTDIFARQNKRSGAWMDSLQSRYKLANGTTQLPIATLTCNFAPPSTNQPPCLSHDEVITLFHEFGHCLHHLLTQIDYRSASGIHGVEWDAVELPSQFFENWCWERASLEKLSAHVETGEPIPKDLFEQLLASKNFLSALGLVRQIEFALFDFVLHTNQPAKTPDFIAETLATVREKTAITPMTSYNRFPHSFSHIFAGGYAAGYYSYLWAEVLSCDAFARFQEEGIFNQKVGRDFLQCILEVGGSRPAEESYQCFRGRRASISALLKHHGISS